MSKIFCIFITDEKSVETSSNIVIFSKKLHNIA